MLRPTLIFIALFATSLSVLAQSGSGTLKGKVTDADLGDPMPFCSVILFLNGNQVTGVNTDMDGEYTIKPIQPGTYDVMVSFVGYQSQKVTGVKVLANKIQFVDITLSPGVMIDEAEVIEYKEPLIDKEGGTSGGTVAREDIDKMPGRDVGTIASTVAGVGTAGTGGGISIRGARTSSTWVYIDGIKVRGSSALPKSAIEQVQVITGGIPANIGDVTGGVVNMSLRNSSSKWFGGAEVISSGLPIGETAYGLDRYGYNLVEGSISGPLLFEKDEEGNNVRPLLGLFLSGNYTYQKDPRPAFDGTYRMTDASREYILANPLRQNISSSGDINGALFNADFLTDTNFVKVPTRMNVGSQSANLVAKIDVNTNETTSLTFGATGAYNRNNSFSYSNMLANWENNLDVLSFDWRGYVKFAQRFNNEEDQQSSGTTLKNVYYSVMADYTQTYQRVQDASHGDNFFRYGHVGTFNVYNQESYDYDAASQRFLHNGWEDTLVTFAPSVHNPELAAINQQYFSLFDYEPYNSFVDGPYESLLEVQNGNALLNGQAPSSTYGLWSYYGAQGNSYSISNNSQFRISASGSGDLGDHAIQVGFEYEQRSDAFFSVSPIGLWTLARLTTNSHIKEINSSDSTLTNVGTDYYVTYQRLIGDNQFEFDRNLRTALNLDPDGNDFITIDALDPDFLSLDLFGADDLLNQGNNYVNYSGYDPYGNRLRGRPTIEDFFNETNDAGYNTRPIQAYEPIYIAGYIMDKFAYDDIIFNVGLRVDRFDANQSVLKDPYVVGERYTVGDVRSELLAQLDPTIDVPSNIGEDYVVYVDALKNPTTVVGYRDGDTWFNAAGTEINDPDILAVNESYPAPWLINAPDAPLTSKSFRDYTPQINFMPRIAFSFNISDEAVFFAHYDILTKRPTIGNRLDPSDYYFLESRASSATLNNPALQPEKTIDYEIGFQQALTTSMALTISAFYRESRDLVSATRVFDAYPIEYVSYDNLDFATTKGMTVSYDLRQTKNLTVRASYTLQFAEGTGSSATTGLNLARSGQPNLRAPIRLSYDQRHQIVGNIDYRYGAGRDYNGPVIGEKQIFKSTGANLQIRGGSGVPYNPQSNFTSTQLFTNNPAPLQQGAINSASLPWAFRFDLSVDRDFSYQKEEGKREYFFNVFVQVLNLLNTRNVNGVYRATGNPDDDGYLNSAFGIQYTNEQNSPLAFQDYYNMKLWNPNQWQLPRRIRVGVRMNF